MKTFLIISIIIALSCQTCVDEFCGLEYSECRKEVFGCKALQQKCERNCVTEDKFDQVAYQCMLECGQKGGASALYYRYLNCRWQNCQDKSSMHHSL